MVVFFGTTVYGQADVVDKRFSVATKFFHIFYVPVLPMGTQLVFDQGMPKDQVRKAMGAEEPEQPPAAPEPPAEGQAEEAPPDEEEIRIPIPWSWKSMLLGYLRGWGFALMLFCGFLGGMLWLMSGNDAWAASMYWRFLLTAGIGVAVAMGSYYGPWNTASPERARQLCEAAGLDPAILATDPSQGVAPQ